MDIIQYGSKEEKKQKNVEEFTCDNCGCKFKADEDEFYVEKGSCFTTSASTTYVYTANVTDKYICSCPQCHKIIIKTKQRLVESPCITLTSTDTGAYVPDHCKNCSNHPSNGGSGNCNCVLGSMGQVTCKG